MRKAVLRLLIGAGAVFAFSGVGKAQPELVANDGLLPFRFPRSQASISIAVSDSGQAKIIWMREVPAWMYQLFLATRDSLGAWDSRTCGIVQGDRIALWMGGDQRAFIHSSPRLLFESEDSLEVRNSLRLPAMDSLGCFHLLDTGPGMLIYRFSRDTLLSFEFVDTLLTSYEIFGVCASPDRGKIAAVFIDNNILYKCLGNAGQPLHMDSTTVRDYDLGIDDYAIDNNGRIVTAYYLPGEYHWADRYVWTEQHGTRWIHPLDDIPLDGTTVELAFCPSRDAIIGVESTNNYWSNSTNIFFSTDGGDTWLASLIYPQGGNSSSPRFIGDTLYLSSQTTNEEVYFQKFSIDYIMEDAVSVEENASLPTSIQLSNYPNPFNSRTTISFNLPREGDISLKVFDVTGCIVAILCRGHSNAGPHEVVWDGQNSSGQPVSSGVYFYRLSFDGDRSVTKRMLLLK